LDVIVSSVNEIGMGMIKVEAVIDGFKPYYLAIAFGFYPLVSTAMFGLVVRVL
jgi:hypothetical protein